jgi:hypothetical protein
MCLLSLLRKTYAISVRSFTAFQDYACVLTEQLNPQINVSGASSCPHYVLRLDWLLYGLFNGTLTHRRARTTCTHNNAARLTPGRRLVRPSQRVQFGDCFFREANVMIHHHSLYFFIDHIISSPCLPAKHEHPQQQPPPPARSELEARKRMKHLPPNEDLDDRERASQLMPPRAPALDPPQPNASKS